MVNTSRKFLFDTSFEGGNANKNAESGDFTDFLGKSDSPQQDAPLTTQEPEEIPLPEGAVSLEDFELAKKSAYAEGYNTGQTEAQANATEAAEMLIAQSITTLGQQLSSLQHNYQAQIQDLQSISMEVALKAINKLFPTLVKSSALEEVTLVFRECLDRLPQEPRLVIRVSDTSLNAVQEKLEQVSKQSGFNGHLVFLSEPGMPEGDVRVEWAEGGAERNSGEMLEEIETILSRAISILSLPNDPGPNDSGPNDPGPNDSEPSDSGPSDPGQTNALSSPEQDKSAPSNEVTQ